MSGNRTCGTCHWWLGPKVTIDVPGKCGCPVPYSVDYKTPVYSDQGKGCLSWCVSYPLSEKFKKYVGINERIVNEKK